MKLLVFILLFSSIGFGQKHYWIGFTDKNNSPYSLNSPGEFLSERALERRSRFSIPIVEEDLPVNDSYISQVLSAGNIDLRYQLKWINGIVVSSSDSLAMDTVGNLPFVEKVELGRRGGAQGNSDKLDVEPVRNSHFPINWEENYPFGATFRQFKLHNAHKLYNLGFRGQGIEIAVIDAGFWKVDEVTGLKHMTENGQIISVLDVVDADGSVYEDHYHGEIVLGCLAGFREGEYIGPACEAGFHLIRTEDVFSETIIEEYNWIRGAEYADSIGVDMINTSLGYTEFDDPSQNHTYNDMDGNTTIAAIGADIAASKGILLFTSAGNSGTNSWKFIGTPGDADSTVTVAATDSMGVIAPFSSYGPAPDGAVKPNVASVGSNIYILAPWNDSLALGSGTSFSSPFLCGMTAALWQALPNKSNMEIKALLESSASLYPASDSTLGYGIPDMFSIYEAETGIIYVEGNDAVSGLYPNPSLGEVHFDYRSSKNQNITLEWFTKDGKYLEGKKALVSPGWNKFHMDRFKFSSYGVIIMKITSEDGVVETEKIVFN